MSQSVLFFAQKTSMDLTSLHILSLSVLALGFSFLWRIASWLKRIHALRRQFPVFPVLFPPDSLFRLLWPKSWQTFHRDWQMQTKRDIYRKIRSDYLALVCLFEYDQIYISDPAAVHELKVTKSEQFPRDMHALIKVHKDFLVALTLV